MRFVIASLILLAQFVASSCLLQAAAPREIDFNFDVKPILSDRCYACHGPDAANREADLRLDTREGAFAALSDDMHIISPGNPARSQLYLRISEEDDDLKMPPVDSKLSLSAEEIETLRLWIQQGAEWKQHWSYLPIRSPAIPEVQDVAWPVGPIDYFVLARLEDEGLRPSKQADKARLIRRLSFDLTGLPPTLEEVEAFLVDESENSYETVVDRADGGGLAGRGQVRRHVRISIRRISSHVALARLGHPRLQRQYALRPIRHVATGRRLVARTNPGPNPGHGL
jgi:hypothetical protein